MTERSFATLGIHDAPVVLAPLAGVSDHPFRRVCAQLGAHLTYVEMISATALLYESRRTLDMLKRHESESVLGVQVTGKSADETAKAIAILDKMPFDTIDINMGCPVKKVVKTGCGSAILRDPARVYETVRQSREATQKPLSVKIRLGWDHTELNALEVLDAAVRGGADWITVHGRTRSDDYSVPVDLQRIGEVKQASQIPVLGNGNIFSVMDASAMQRIAGVDGVMVSRGALGNPWVFRQIRGDMSPVTLDEWVSLVCSHLTWQSEEYGERGAGAICMRKHLLWYAKGWPGVKKLREDVNNAATLSAAKEMILTFANALAQQGITTRMEITDAEERLEGRFSWDPKYEMDRKLDRGVGDDGLETVTEQQTARV